MKLKHPLGIAVIITLVLLAALILILYSPWAAPKTPAVKLPELVDKLPEQTGAAVPQELTEVEVVPQTVQAVIATLNRPDSYSRSILVESFWDGGSSRTDIRVWVKSGMQRLSVTGEGTEENYLLSGGTVTLWYGSDTAHRFVYAGDDSHLADDLQRIPTYEDILDLDPASIRTAGCAMTENGKWRILVSAVNTDLGYLDIYAISLDTGLLEMAEQWDGDTLIYRMQSGEAELSAPDDQLFLLPGLSS